MFFFDVKIQNDLLYTTSISGKVYALDIRNISSNSRPTGIHGKSYGDNSICATYLPFKLLRAQSRNENLQITSSTIQLCGIKILDNQFLTTLSGDGTIITFDPFASNLKTYSEFNNGNLLAYYQSSNHYSQNYLNTNMFDILPSSINSNSLIVVPSLNSSFSILGIFSLF